LGAGASCANPPPRVEMRNCGSIRTVGGMQRFFNREMPLVAFTAVFAFPAIYRRASAASTIRDPAPLVLT
jgi:hypothetical protein